MVLIAESEELLVEKLERWRKGLEAGELRVNFGKTKVRNWCRTSEELRQISVWRV